MNKRLMIIILAGMLLPVLFWTGCAPREKKAADERQDFADLMIETFRGQGISGEITYEPGKFLLLVGDDGKREVFLGNIYNEYLKTAEADREAILVKFAQVARQSGSTLPDTLEKSRNHLFPKLRHPAYHSLVTLNARLKGETFPPPPHHMITDHFRVNLVYDWGDYVQDVGKEDLEKWNISFNQALDIAKENLKALSSQPFLKPFPGVYASPWKDSYDASRLVLPELFNGLELKGAPVVVMPTRDILLVSGSEDEKGLKMMAELVLDAFKESRFLSGTALRRVENRWEVFLPSAGHPLRNDFMNAYTTMQNGDYQFQKQLLDKIYQKEGKAVMVSPYKLFTHGATGNIVSNGTWYKHMPTLLPVATHIVFYDEDGPADKRVLGPVRWEIVKKVAGDLLEGQELSPPRYLAKLYPTEEQIVKMLEEERKDSK